MSLNAEIRSAQMRQNRRTTPKKEPPAQKSGFEESEEQAKQEHYADRFDSAVESIEWEELPSPYKMLVEVEEYWGEEFEDLEIAVETAKAFQDHPAFDGLES